MTISGDAWMAKLASLQRIPATIPIKYPQVARSVKINSWLMKIYNNKAKQKMYFPIRQWNKRQ